jgi:hypothetical protein
MKALILTAALAISSAAFAQGAPLLLPAKEQTPAQKAYAEARSKKPDVVKVTPYTVDANALNSNVISITVEGKTYVFVGKREKMSAEHESWSSHDGRNTAALVRSDKGVSGSLWLDGAPYQIENGLLIKEQAPSTPMRAVDVSKPSSAPNATRKPK